MLREIKVENGICNIISEHLQRVKQGDVEAFNDLVNITYNKLLNFVMQNYNLSLHDTSDVLQNAYLEAFNNIQQFNEPYFGSWLYTIVRNNAVDVLKSIKKREAIEVRSLDKDMESINCYRGSFTLSETIESEELEIYYEDEACVKKRFNNLIGTDSLNENQKAALTYRYLNNMSYQEIADIIGIPLNTVKTTLKRAKEKLKNSKNLRDLVNEYF